MRRKVLAILLVFVFVFAQTGTAFAKSFGGRSSSHGYKSSSSSRSYKSSSSSSKSSSSSSSKKSSGYTGSSSSSKSGSSSSSSSRSNPGSYSSSSKSSTAKTKYMNDYYKQQTSKMNYKKYSQNLNDSQKKAYDSSMNRNYNFSNRMNFEDSLRSRPQRISYYNSRPIRIHVNTYYFGGPLSYGSAFVGPWDMWFLMRASDLFWYHHWLEIAAYREYFEAAEFAQREQAMNAMTAQNIARNPDYIDPDVDYDLQFSDDYQQKHLDTMYYSNKHTSSAGSVIFTFIIIIGIVVVMIIIIKKVSRPKYKRPARSRIY